ncbi:MAG: hypothetical protein IT168_16845 [Bryobacterales bacterium]|nr:hypothetical protein [Bryobacterales bacterium]
MPKSAMVYASCVSAAGLLVLVHALASLHIGNLPLLLTYMAFGLAVATLKVPLPGLAGTITGSFVFVLAACAQLSGPETILIAGASAAVQCLWRPKHKFAPIQVAFSVSVLMIAASATYLITHAALGNALSSSVLAFTALAVTILFGVNSTLVAIVLCFVQEQPLTKVYRQYNVWAFPYYLIGSVIAAGLISITGGLGWALTVTAFPMLYSLFAFYDFMTLRLSPAQR